MAPQRLELRERSRGGVVLANEYKLAVTLDGFSFRVAALPPSGSIIAKPPEGGRGHDTMHGLVLELGQPFADVPDEDGGGAVG